MMEHIAAMAQAPLQWMQLSMFSSTTSCVLARRWLL